MKIVSSARSFLRSLLLFAAGPLLLPGHLARAADALPAEAVRQIESLLAEKASRTPAQRKLDSQLLQAVRESRGQAMAAGVSLEPIGPETDLGGRVLLDVAVASPDKVDAVIGKLEDLGGEIVHPSWEHRTIRARLALSAAEGVAALPDVAFVQFAVQALTSGTAKTPRERGAGTPGRPRSALLAAQRATVVRSLLARLLASGRVSLAGAVNSQGDRTHRADDARNTYGFAGQGVRIGVLSDSFNSLGGAAADIANGDLPGPGNPVGNTTPVTVLQDIANGSDEGRAMLQIVHDVAPKAQLFFATAFASEASFASNIVALRNAPYNCDIIIDDVFYFDEPVFQDGLVAQAVNVVTASGGLYFSSAGNEGSVAKGTSGYFEGDFNDAGSPAFTFPGGAKAGTIHNFGTVGSPVNGDIITTRGNVYSLNWADPAGASSNDYDLFLVSSTGTVKGQSTNVQSGTQLAYEQVASPALAAGDRLVVFKTAAAAVRAFAINTVRGRLTVATTGQTHGHSSAVNAFSVAAAPAVAPGPYPGAFSGASPVESFSSDGPRRIFYNQDGTPITPGNVLFGTGGGTLRNKPDLTAADGVSTTLPSGGLNPFFGTSAAAPHAGAIAGLLKSANPGLTPAQIRTILTTTAVDVESAGWDNISGAGIVQAFQAMQAVAPTPQAALVLGTTTAAEGAFSNLNGILEPGELGTLVVQLTNFSLVGATSVEARLTTLTPGVTITQGSASYGTIAASASATNGATPFLFGIGSSVPCGTVISFVLTVSFGGGASPQVFMFTVPTGVVPGASIAGAIGSAPPTGPGFTSSGGSQTGRLNRFGVVSTCAAPKASPGIFGATGARAYHAYTFTNGNPASQCVNVTLTTSAITLFSVAYTSAGFVPASPGSNYLADPGSSNLSTTYSFTAPAGQAFTVVVHEVNTGGATGQGYTLNVSLANCTAGPACTPVSITTSTLAAGTVGTAYLQALAATGGSGSYAFSAAGSLPAGLALSGSAISGTPTQAGTFPITVTATDVAGCTPASKPFSLVTSCPVPPPLVVTAPATVGSASSGNVASIASIPGATYNWGIVNGTITGGQGTNTVTFTAGSAGTLSLTVNAVVGSCFAGGGFANVSVTNNGQLFTVNPCRAVDTRGPNAPSIAAAGAPDRTFTLTGGTCGIPSDAKAVATNVTVVNPGAAGSLVVYRADTTAPAASMISFNPGGTRAAQAMVQLALDGSGTVKVNNTAAGTLDLLIDVTGYFK